MPYSITPWLKQEEITVLHILFLGLYVEVKFLSDSIYYYFSDQAATLTGISGNNLMTIVFKRFPSCRQDTRRDTLLELVANWLRHEH